MSDDYVPHMGNFYLNDAIEVSIVPVFLAADKQHDLGNFVTNTNIKEIARYGKTVTFTFFESEDSLEFLNLIRQLVSYHITVKQLDSVGGSLAFMRLDDRCEWECSEFRTVNNALCVRDVTFKVVE